MNKKYQHTLKIGKTILYTIEQWEKENLDAVIYTEVSTKEYKEFKKWIQKENHKIKFVSLDISVCDPKVLQKLFTLNPLTQ